MTGSLDPTRHTDGEDNAGGGEPFQSSMQLGARKGSLPNRIKLHRSFIVWEEQPSDHHVPADVDKRKHRGPADVGNFTACA
jgi:hypothetical protein